MVSNETAVLLARDLDAGLAKGLLDRYDVQLCPVADGDDIQGSFWGAPEAGILQNQVYVRADTPVHSLLHEFSHVICMPPEVRAVHAGNAESDDIEEAAVCYLQILLADELAGVGRDRLMADMDRWGYSFRLGNTRRWFEQDADDARAWLLNHGVISAADRLTFRLRTK